MASNKTAPAPFATRNLQFGVVGVTRFALIDRAFLRLLGPCRMYWVRCLKPFRDAIDNAIELMRRIDARFPTGGET
jgi:hypothetical protein